MSASEAIDALERFFLDLIGTVIPGSCLIVGQWLVIGQPEIPLISPDALSGNSANWAFFLIASYVAGHGITSIGQRAVKPFVVWVASVLRRVPVLRKAILRPIRSEHEEVWSVLQSQPFRDFVQLCSPAFHIQANDIPQDKDKVLRYVHDQRNAALTLLPNEQYHRVLRFMFIALLNLGIATALWMISTTWLAFILFTQLESLGNLPYNPLVLLVPLLASLPFVERHFHFHDISIRVPFDMAVSLIRNRERLSDSDQGSRETLTSPKKAVAGATRKRLRVYLGGGFRSGWQDRVLSASSYIDFADPRIHALNDESAYTSWDLEAIRNCDWILAYMEATNPGGYALALEIGYAKALEKKIILVNEKSAIDVKGRRHFGMLHACADVEFESLEEAIEFVSKLPDAAGSRSTS